MPDDHAPLLPQDYDLAAQLVAGERRALAKAITLIESTRFDHEARARALLNHVLPRTGHAIRLGISGAPGAGKSTFIEAFGNYLVDQGMHLAVLAIDPSSSVTGGSILGDKTRMETLCQRAEAFIRPSPSAGSLGGVAAKTREAMLLCEAAGFDVVIIETVGVGQSETAVAGMVDMFVLLQLPNAGDDLQAIKKGIVELADLIAINKSDLNPQATIAAKAQWTSALHILRPASRHWSPPVLTLSALKKEGLSEFWNAVLRYRETLIPTGEFEEKRRRQAVDWMWQLIHARLAQCFQRHPAVKDALPDVTQKVASGCITPEIAASSLFEAARVFEIQES